MLDPIEIHNAAKRISKYLRNTPVFSSQELNSLLGSKIYFKMDCFQKTGAFKIRGVLNHLLELHEKNIMPKKIVAYSTGNHALAIGYFTRMFNLDSRIYLPKEVSNLKKNIAKYYGSEVIEVKTREEAEKLSKHDIDNGYYFLHPSDNDLTIAGAGTMCFEALKDLEDENIKVDAIFASCGGGGLLAGSYLAKEAMNSTAKIYGAEPENANDAYLSLRNKSLYKFKSSPDTIADGLRALSISERTYEYLQKLDGFYLETEQDISYWTIWLMQLLKATCEPSSAVAMSGACQWLKENSVNKNILVLISGGNVDSDFYKQFTKIDEITKKIPSLDRIS